MTSVQRPAEVGGKILSPKLAVNVNDVKDIKELRNLYIKKENEYAKIEAVLKQKILLLEMELAEGKVREQNLKKMSEAIMHSFNDLSNDKKSFAQSTTKNLQEQLGVQAKSIIEQKNKSNEIIKSLETEVGHLRKASVDTQMKLTEYEGISLKYQRMLKEIESKDEIIEELEKKNKELEKKNKLNEEEKTVMLSKAESDSRIKSSEDKVIIEKIKKQTALELDKVRNEADKSLAELKNIFDKDKALLYKRINKYRKELKICHEIIEEKGNLNVLFNKLEESGIYSSDNSAEKKANETLEDITVAKNEEVRKLKNKCDEALERVYMLETEIFAMKEEKARTNTEHHTDHNTELKLEHLKFSPSQSRREDGEGGIIKPEEGKGVDRARPGRRKNISMPQNLQKAAYFMTPEKVAGLDLIQRSRDTNPNFISKTIIIDEVSSNQEQNLNTDNFMYFARENLKESIPDRSIDMKSSLASLRNKNLHVKNQNSSNLKRNSLAESRSRHSKSRDPSESESLPFSYDEYINKSLLIRSMNKEFLKKHVEITQDLKTERTSFIENSTLADNTDTDFGKSDSRSRALNKNSQSLERIEREKVVEWMKCEVCLLTFPPQEFIRHLKDCGSDDQEYLTEELIKRNKKSVNVNGRPPTHKISKPYNAADNCNYFNQLSYSKYEDFSEEKENAYDHFNEGREVKDEFAEKTEIKFLIGKLLKAKNDLVKTTSVTNMKTDRSYFEEAGLKKSSSPFTRNTNQSLLNSSSGGFLSTQASCANKEIHLTKRRKDMSSLLKK